MNGHSDFLLLGIALAIGLLVGVERGWHEREAGEGRRVAGIRTFGLIGLFGGSAALIAQALGQGWLFGLALLTLGALLATGHAAALRHDDDVSLTTAVAGLLTGGLGGLAALGFPAEAAAVGVVATLLLGYKPELHRWVAAIDAEELRAGLKFLLISVVVLPVLPDRGYGPWQALNPYEIWWMVVLISGISFAGYAAMRLVGVRRGSMVTGLLAGFASSTALTLHFARLCRDKPALTAPLAPAILLASGTMFPRMLAVAAIIHLPAAGAVWLPALAMGALALSVAILLDRLSARKAAPDMPADMGSPLRLGSALGFGLLLGAIMLAAAGLQAEFSDAGLLLLAALSGISDVDAITLTLTRLSAEGTDAGLVARGLVVAAAVNSLVKGVLAFAIGGPALGLRVLLPLAAAAAAGMLIVWL